MNTLALQLRGLVPTLPAVGRLEKSARLLVLVRGGVDDFGVARVNDQVINEEARSVEAFEARPRLAAIGRRVNLPVNGSEVEALGVLRVDDERAHVAAERPRHLPTQKVRRGGVGVFAVHGGGESYGSERQEKCEQEEGGVYLLKRAIHFHREHHGIQNLRAARRGV